MVIHRNMNRKPRTSRLPPRRPIVLNRKKRSNVVNQMEAAFLASRMKLPTNYKEFIDNSSLEWLRKLAESWQTRSTNASNSVARSTVKTQSALNISSTSLLNGSIFTLNSSPFITLLPAPIMNQNFCQKNTPSQCAIEKNSLPKNPGVLKNVVKTSLGGDRQDRDMPFPNSIGEKENELTNQVQINNTSPINADVLPIFNHQMHNPIPSFWEPAASRTKRKFTIVRTSTSKVLMSGTDAIFSQHYSYDPTKTSHEDEGIDSHESASDVSHHNEDSCSLHVNKMRD